MMRASNPKDTRKRPRGKTKFPGIVDIAAQLGVNRNHLHRVLTGERTSERLKAGYQSLAGQKGGRA